MLPPENEKFDILPFVINTPIINNLNNKKIFQQLEKLNMLRFNDGIYFSDNILRCFLLWMKYQSVKIEFLNSLCFYGEEILKITQKFKMIKDHFLKYNLIFSSHQYGVHW